jgi:basic membrane protein A
VIALAKATRAGITAGTINPFAGEIKDQSGKVRVKAGEKADDGLLAGMNFYVQGLDGSIPK